jgi:hypothetical protein
MGVVVGDIVGREKCPHPFVLAAEQIRILAQAVEVVIGDGGLKLVWLAAIVEAGTALLTALRIICADCDSVCHAALQGKKRVSLADACRCI